jgi:hypothetical protein
MGRKLLSVLTPDSLSLSLSDGGNVPSQPIDESTLVLSPGDLVALGARPTFVFRPGSVPSGNVYNDWATMMADVVVQQGPKWIEIDAAFATANVPAGLWNVDEVTFVGKTTNSILHFLDGAQLTYVTAQMQNGVRFDCKGLSPVFTTVAGVFTSLRLSGGAGISCSAGASPFIQQSGANAQIVLDDLSFFGGGAAPATATVDAAHTLFLVAMNGSRLFDNAVAGAGTLNFSFSDDVNVSGPTQTVVAVTSAPLALAQLLKFTPGVAGNWAPVPTQAAAALDQLAAPNVISEVNAAPIGAAGTITYTSVATLAKKKSGKVRVSISISVTSSGIAGLDFRMYRDTVSGPNQLPPHGFESNTVALSARFTCTLDWVDTLPDTAAHAYVMQVIADAGTVALANGDCAVVANEL